MASAALTDAQFWAVLEAVGPFPLGRQDDHLDSVRSQLLELTPAQVSAFSGHFDRRVAAAFGWDLWGAAYAINGGCSDDGFEYFRRWLVAQGRSVYEAALANPDSLAGLADPERDDHESEDVGYAAHEVYEELTGGEVPDSDAEQAAEPAGEEWDFDDDAEVRRRLPKLAAIYLK